MGRREGEQRMRGRLAGRSSMTTKKKKRRIFSRKKSRHPPPWPSTDKSTNERRLASRGC